VPRTCTVCRHPQRDAIDAAIVAGTPYRRIAAQYRLAEASIRRHKAHIAAHIANARQAKARRHATDYWAVVERVIEKLERTLESSDVAKDISSVSRELIGAVRMALEAKGELRSGSQVQVNVAIASSSEWLTLQARIIAALGPYAEARQAVLLAIGGDHVAPGAARSTARPRDASAAVVVAANSGHAGA